MVASEHWKDQPEDKDFAAALTYLSLLIEPQEAKKLAKALEQSSELEHIRSVALASRAALDPRTRRSNPSLQLRCYQPARAAPRCPELYDDRTIRVHDFGVETDGVVCGSNRCHLRSPFVRGSGSCAQSQRGAYQFLAGASSLLHKELSCSVLRVTTGEDDRR